MGGNMNGYEASWEDGTLQHLEVLTKAWKFNCIRLVCYIKGYHRNCYPTWEFNNDLDAIIEAYTSKGVVVMLEAHDWTGRGIDVYSNSNYSKGGKLRSPNEKETLGIPAERCGGKRTGQNFPWKPDKIEEYESQLAILVEFFGHWAVKYKDNPYLWLNPMNEPGCSAAKYYDENGNKLKAVPDYWLHMHGRFIEEMRKLGSHHIIVCDGIASGNDHGLSWSNPADHLIPWTSAMCTWGDSLLNYNGKKQYNVVLSFHTYEMWGGSGTLMDEYINYAHEHGIALLIGEAGCWPNSPNHLRARAWRNIVATRAPARGVGVIVWHLQSGNGMHITKNGFFNKIDNWANPSNLSFVGNDLWQWTNKEGFSLGKVPPVDSSIPRSIDFVGSRHISSFRPVNLSSLAAKNMKVLTGAFMPLPVSADAGWSLFELNGKAVNLGIGMKNGVRNGKRSSGLYILKNDIN
jgi:hypothetical protein